MKQISFRKCEGETLRRVFLCSEQWKALATKSVVSAHGRNFDVKSGQKTWLVLDTYGNPDLGIPPGFARKIFGKGYQKETIAIDRKTGEVLKTAFYRFDETDPEKEGHAIGFAQVYDNKPSPVVPKSYLAKLDILASAKRPFAYTYDFQIVCEFHTRDLTRADLREAVRIRLDFGLGQGKEDVIELASGMHRKVGPWQ